MKGLQTFLLSLLVLAAVLCACGRHNAYRRELAGCDRMVTDHPHEVVDRLEALDSAALRSSADSAMYELLYGEAMRRLGITFTRDTLIRRAAKYFSSVGDDGLYARALLQWGLTLYDARRYVDAVQRLKTAERVAARVQSPELTYRIYMALGDVNRAAGCGTLSLACVRKALTAARHSGRTDDEGAALNALALAFLQTDSMDSFALAVRSVRAVLPRVAKDRRPALVSTVAMDRLIAGDTVTALRMLEDYCDADPDRRASLYLGDVYAAQGRMKQAVSIWYDAADSFDPDICRTALQRLADAAASRSDTASALYLSQKLNEVYARAVSPEETAQVADVQTRFDKETEQGHARRMWLVCAVVGAAVLVAATALWSYDRRRMHRLRRDIAKYQKDQAKPVLWTSTDALLSAPEVQRLHEAASRGEEADRTMWNGLHRFLSEHDARLSALLADHPTLAWGEVNVIMLIRLRFAPSEMAVLTGTSSQSVTNLRVRLLRKMFGEKGGARDFDARIRLL